MKYGRNEIKISLLILEVYGEWGQKISYNDIISAVDDFFDERDPSTATLMEEVCGLQGRLCWKINFSGYISWEYYGLPINFSADPQK